MQTRNIIIMFSANTSVARSSRGLHTFFGTVQGKKETYRRAIIFSVVSAVFLILGCILTYLAFKNVFGSRVTGPAMLGLGFIAFLLAIQRFVRAKKILAQNRNGDQSLNSQTVGVVLEENNDEGGAITVIVDGIHFRNAWRDPDIVSDTISPPSYTEATDTSYLEPPSILPIVTQDESEAPPTYEEAMEESHHSLDETMAAERKLD